MVKRKLNILARDCSSLCVGFSRNLDVTQAEFKYKNNDINLLPYPVRDHVNVSAELDYSDVYVDVGCTRTHHVPDNVWFVRHFENIKRKSLIVHLYTSAKPGNECVIKPLLENKNLIQEIPTKWFRWSPFNKSFMDIYQETLDSIPKSMKSVLSTTPSGHVKMVLRPSNLTHAMLAFNVIDPELFRICLFDIILVEINAINERKRKGMYTKCFEKSIREKIRQCGLEVISDNTFGQEGVYNDKYTEPDLWALTPFIDGYDVRVIKAGNKLYSHTGWIDLKRTSATIINPQPLALTNPELNKEILEVMDNCITPLSGSLDLRWHHNGKYYFLETSHCFSSERYSESFIKKVRENIFDLMLQKIDELVGDYNDGWKERFDLYQEKVIEEKKNKYESDTSEVKHVGGDFDKDDYIEEE